MQRLYMFGFEGIKGVLFKFKEEQEMEEQEYG